MDATQGMLDRQQEQAQHGLADGMERVAVLGDEPLHERVDLILERDIGEHVGLRLCPGQVPAQCTGRFECVRGGVQTRDRAIRAATSSGTHWCHSAGLAFRNSFAAAVAPSFLSAIAPSAWLRSWIGTWNFPSIATSAGSPSQNARDTPAWMTGSGSLEPQGAALFRSVSVL